MFKKYYKFEHKSIEELKYLSSIKTSRILMPASLIFDSGELNGYTMTYIKNEKDIFSDTIDNLLNEEEKSELKDIIKTNTFTELLEKENLIEILNKKELINFLGKFHNNPKKWIRLRKTNKGRSV
mgnify:CR=1 FL=1